MLTATWAILTLAVASSTPEAGGNRAACWEAFDYRGRPLNQTTAILGAGGSFELNLSFADVDSERQKLCLWLEEEALSSGRRSLLLTATERRNRWRRFEAAGQPSPAAKKDMANLLELVAKKGTVHARARLDVVTFSITLKALPETACEQQEFQGVAYASTRRTITRPVQILGDSKCFRILDRWSGEVLARGGLTTRNTEVQLALDRERSFFVDVGPEPAARYAFVPEVSRPCLRVLSATTAELTGPQLLAFIETSTSLELKVDHATPDRGRACVTLMSGPLGRVQRSLPFERIEESAGSSNLQMPIASLAAGDEGPEDCLTNAIQATWADIFGSLPPGRYLGSFAVGDAPTRPLELLVGIDRALGQTILLSAIYLWILLGGAVSLRRQEVEAKHRFGAYRRQLTEARRLLTDPGLFDTDPSPDVEQTPPAVRRSEVDPVALVDRAEIAAARLFRLIESRSVDRFARFLPRRVIELRGFHHWFDKWWVEWAPPMVAWLLAICVILARESVFASILAGLGLSVMLFVAFGHTILALSIWLISAWATNSVGLLAAEFAALTLFVTWSFAFRLSGGSSAATLADRIEDLDRNLQLLRRRAELAALVDEIGVTAEETPRLLAELRALDVAFATLGSSIDEDEFASLSTRLDALVVATRPKPSSTNGATTSSQINLNLSGTIS